MARTLSMKMSQLWSFRNIDAMPTPVVVSRAPSLAISSHFCVGFPQHNEATVFWMVYNTHINGHFGVGLSLAFYCNVSWSSINGTPKWWASPGWSISVFVFDRTWVWVNTYRYIFSGMNIHLPAILGFTRGTRVLTHPHIVLLVIPTFFWQRKNHLTYQFAPADLEILVPPMIISSLGILETLAMANLTKKMRIETSPNFLSIFRDFHGSSIPIFNGEFSQYDQISWWIFPIFHGSIPKSSKISGSPPISPSRPTPAVPLSTAEPSALETGRPWWPTSARWPPWALRWRKTATSARRGRRAADSPGKLAGETLLEKHFLDGSEWSGIWMVLFFGWRSTWGSEWFFFLGLKGAELLFGGVERSELRHEKHQGGIWETCAAGTWSWADWYSTQDLTI